MTSQSVVRRFVLGLLAVLPMSGIARPILAVTSCQLVAQKRISATVFEYTYRVVVHNSGTAADDIEISLRSTPPGVSAVRRTAGIPHLEGKATGLSDPAIVVRHDRTKPFRTDALGWVLRATDATFTGYLSGAPNSPAVAATQNYNARPQPRHLATDSVGNTVELTQVQVEFAADATIAQVNAAVGAVGGRIVGMGKGQRTMEVSIPDAGSVAHLNQQIKTLLGMPGVRVVWPVLVEKPPSPPL